MSFLGSDLASYINGQEIYVDGGWLSKGLKKRLILMNKKKYLLIGDHRTCENYGSIATGDQLIELMKPRRLSVIPITRMDQDYDYMPLTFEEFDDFADKVKKGWN